MNIHAYYRSAVWLPLLVPAATAFVMIISGARPAPGVSATLVQMIVYSGLYGGVPYALLAAYATWWIGDRPERAIRRRALAAPLWMVLLWLPVSLLVGVLYGRVETFSGLFWLGTAVILPLGYAYVGIVLLLRPLICRQRSGAHLQSVT
jgi:hypothetical protein